MEEIKYIPGDLVIFKTPFESSSTCVGIVKFLGNISDIVLLCPYTDLNLEYFIKVENIQGIPITSEILEKNEWVKEEENEKYSLYKHKENYELFVLYIKADDKCNAYVGTKILLTNFKFVHQLQHLLFGLGLPMNLKV